MATIKGSSHNNTLTGTSSADLILAGKGDDTLNGLAGNDTLAGGIGNDTMFGGLGNDSYYVDSLLDVVSEAGGGGTDTVYSRISYTLGDNIENLVLVDSSPTNGTGNTLDNRITGNFGANALDGGVGSDTLNGSKGNDSLTGGAGNDFLVGGKGADTMLGGAGNDLYSVDNAGDEVNEAGGSGTDSVTTTVSFTLSGGVENMTLAGGAAINGTGNGLDNQIFGNQAANVLSGEDGSDYLRGKGGNDTINGGNGNDNIAGQDGNDVLTGGAGADKLTGGAGDDVLNVTDGGANIDTVAFGPGSGHDTVNGFDNSLLGTHDLIDVSAFGYTNFLDFTTGGGLILPNLSGGILTSFTVQFASTGESAVFNVTDLLGPGITAADFKFA